MRPQLERSKPIRTAGGFYRTAEGGRPGVAGVPLTAAEDSVVAAVRMAYNVAEAQIERSARLARRLREAGDRAVGARSDRKAVDAVEQLMVKAIQGALVWLERTADDPDPVKRLLVAQYRLAGSMFGLTPSDAPRSPGEARRRIGAERGRGRALAAGARSTIRSGASGESRSQGSDSSAQCVLPAMKSRVELFAAKSSSIALRTLKAIR